MKYFAKFRLVTYLIIIVSLGFRLGSAEELLLTVPLTPVKITAVESGLEIDAGDEKILTNCQAYLASRPVGSQTWSEETVPYRVESQSPDQLSLTAVFANFRAVVMMKRDDAGRWTISGQLVSMSNQPIEVARFHYLDGIVNKTSMNLLAGHTIKSTDTLVSSNAKFETRWGHWGVLWPLLKEPIHDSANVGISSDYGILGADWNSPGFFVGFTGPGTAFGEIGIRTARPQTGFFTAVLLDAVQIEPHTTRTLENALLSYGDSQDEFRNWILACRGALGPARVRPPLVGYCSWYQRGSNVQPEDIRRAIRTFSTFEKPPGGRTIQIDDGFQVCPGDWSGRGKWKDELNKLPKEISDAGFIPGLWVAPTAIQENSPVAKQHPDWLQHDAAGKPCIRFMNWGPTYYLDPDNPDAKKYISDTLSNLRQDGWNYFKIDFAYTVSSSRVKYDPHKTTFETLRDEWKLFRAAVGEDALINSCIGGIYRYSIGSVDISRIGGDIGGNFDKVRSNISDMLLRSYANGVWFQADPDVFYMRQENSKLTFEQSSLLTDTQGLLGTAFLTSDFADQWTPTATEVVQRFWSKSGPRVPMAQHFLLRQDMLPNAISVAYGNGEYSVGIYNWDPQAKDVSVMLTDLRLPAGINYTVTSAYGDPEKVALVDGNLTIKQQPGESVGIIRLKTTK